MKEMISSSVTVSTGCWASAAESDIFCTLSNEKLGDEGDRNAFNFSE